MYDQPNSLTQLRARGDNLGCGETVPHFMGVPTTAATTENRRAIKHADRVFTANSITFFHQVLYMEICPKRTTIEEKMDRQIKER
jgi:hypothetical protein